KSISPRAKGVLCYLLSMKDTWETHPRQLAQALAVGKDQIYSVLNELLKQGYAFKTEARSPMGRFSSTVYEFYENKLPESERYKEKSTVSGFPDAGNPDTEIQTLSITNPSDYQPKGLYSPPIPPHFDEPAAPPAKAGKRRVDPPPKKVMKKLQDISPDIKIAVEKMAIALKSANHDWKI